MTNRILPRRELLEARTRTAPYLHRTPVMTSETLDRTSGLRVYMKCENFQRAGSFKTRGAMNFLAQLSPEELKRGVIAHSSGNHAGAVALAARTFGAQATIVMPRPAPGVKLRATEGYGARVHLSEPNIKAREAMTRKLEEETGAIMVHPYDHEYTIFGQSTAAAELLEDVPDLDLIFAPVSGGGLLSGTALAAANHASPVRVMGCEPAIADDARRSLHEGRLVDDPAGPTIADGLRANLAPMTFDIIRDLVEDILAFSEEEIVEAMTFIWERVKIVVEPSGAIALAPALFRAHQLNAKKIGVILSGGNVTAPFKPSGG